METLKMIFEAPINNLGYGICGFNIAKNLFERVNLSLFPIGDVSIPDVNHLSSIQKSINNRFFDKNSPSIKLYHQHSLLEHIGRGKYYGYPIFELTKFSEFEKFNLNYCDEIIVSSDWAKKIILAETNKSNNEVHVVPFGVDTNIFKPTDNISNSDTYKFFSFSKWEKRKGHDILVECFNKAFEFNDKVELYLHHDNPFLTPNQTSYWVNLYKNSKLASKIKILPRVRAHQDVANLIKGYDCFVGLSRAEGWFLDLIEAMACSKPVITTNYSAHTQYCNSSNSFLVDIDELEEAHDNSFFKHNNFGGQWAKLGYNQMEQTIEYMRKCYKENIRQNEAGRATAEEFTWENTATKIIKAIE